MTRNKLIILHVLCWVIPFLLSIGLLINGCVASADVQFILPLPGTYFCFPRFLRDSTLYLFYIPVLLLLLFSFVNIIVAIAVIVQRNRQIFYFQWRTLAFAIHESIFYILLQILIYYFGYIHWDAGVITLYPSCVASYPQDPSPPCMPYYLDSFWYYSLFSAWLTSWLIILTFYMYWTNALMWKWWYLLFRDRSIPLKETVYSTHSKTSNERE